MKKDSQIINQWTNLNKEKSIYQYICIGLGAMCFFFLILTYSMSTKDAIVVGLDRGSKHFYTGEKQGINIEESDLKELAAQYVTLRYTWNKEQLPTLEKSLTPIVSTGLIEKILKSMEDKEKAVMGGEFTQDTFIKEIKVTEGGVFLKIYRIVTIQDKASLVSPIELLLKMVQGKPNNFNPLGLYVNAEIIYENQ